MAVPHTLLAPLVLALHLGLLLLTLCVVAVAAGTAAGIRVAHSPQQGVVGGCRLGCLQIVEALPACGWPLAGGQPALHAVQDGGQGAAQRVVVLQERAVPQLPQEEAHEADQEDGAGGAGQPLGLWTCTCNLHCSVLGWLGLSALPMASFPPSHPAAPPAARPAGPREGGPLQPVCGLHQHPLLLLLGDAQDSGQHVRHAGAAGEMESCLRGAALVARKVGGQLPRSPSGQLFWCAGAAGRAAQGLA